jgi:biotin carboxylase
LSRVLLFATTTGYQIRSFGEAAEKLGVRLVFASDRCDRLEDPWWDRAIPVRFHDEAASMEAVLSAIDGLRPGATGRGIDGVLAVGDRPAILAARVARALGLRGHPPEAARASRNKLESRAALRAAGVETPWFTPVSLEDDPRELAGSIPYPCVLKPLALSGSRGVMRVDDPRSLVAAFDRLRRILQSPDVRAERDAVHTRALVESFVPGREYAVEGLLHEGVFRPLAIFDKPDPLDGPFFEETIYVTPSRAPDPVQGRIVETIARAAAALGLHHGPVHAECRVNDGIVSVLEVAGRPIGGLCAKALRFADGSGATMSLEELLLRHAIGGDVSAVRREAAASGVMMIPIPQRGVFRGADGVEEARRVPGIGDVRITAKPDTVLLPLPEGRSYLGFVFARGESPAIVEGALRDAHARLSFAIEKELPVVSGDTVPSPRRATGARRHGGP